MRFAHQSLRCPQTNKTHLNAGVIHVCVDVVRGTSNCSLNSAALGMAWENVRQLVVS